jgi:anti-sigma regulatory factor (Ser/Thr protein kinase)
MHAGTRACPWERHVALEGIKVLTLSAHVSGRATEPFRHEAVFYSGVDGFVDAVLPFVREGLDLGEPVMVATLADRVRALEEALGPHAARVLFVDMLEIGGNPARIIPEWREFVASAPPGSRVRGVGEPVWAGRRDEELAECSLHEALLNVAFDEGPAWRLMCPYDTDALSARVLDDALRTHPVVEPRSGRAIEYAGHHHALSAFAEPLPEPPEHADAIPFGAEDLPGLRDLVRRLALRAGVRDDAAEDLVLAAHELATNSLVHGGGSGTLRAWAEPDAFVVEVRDAGAIEDPLVGRELTSGMSEGGRGVWMANQLCDLVQVRSTVAGTVIRLFAWL